MAYTPNNLCVYIYAFVGCQAGLVASGKVPSGAAFTDPALKADAFAQAVDTAWGVGGYTTADLQQIQGCSYGVWALGRSPIRNPEGKLVSAYVTEAAAIVAAVRAGTAQIVAEGIDPNGCGGSVASGPLIWVANTTEDIEIDSTSESDPTPLCSITLTVPAAGMVAIVTFGMVVLEEDDGVLGANLGQLYATMTIDNSAQDGPGVPLFSNGEGGYITFVQRTIQVPVTAGSHTFAFGGATFGLPTGPPNDASVTVLDDNGGLETGLHGAHLIVELVTPQT
jgi:hypothetical protein